MILGNDICGGQVWPKVSPEPVVASKLLEAASVSSAQEVFPVCAVTCTHSKEASARVDAAFTVKSIPLSKLLAMVSRNEWIKEQGADGSLSLLWDQIVPHY